MKKSHWIILVCILLYGCKKPPAGYETITVKGSDTEVNVALALAEAFMSEDTAVSVAVTGGGSGAGIAALINQKTDIANSSRPMKPEELRLANERGVSPLSIVFAVDALALAVHESLPVDSLTLEQAGQIFSGKTANWSAFGGADLPISLYGRQSNSGTYVYFRDSILKAEYAPHHKQMNGTAQIVEALRHDRAGIGYVGVGYLLKEKGGTMPGIKILKIKSKENSPAISPVKEAAISNGSYPLVRPLFQYTNSIPKGKLREFIEFGLSEKGQRIVSETGYYRIFPAHLEHNIEALKTNNELSERH